MKKENKKNTSVALGWIGVFGGLLCAFGFVDLTLWEIVSGLIIAAIGGIGCMAFDPSIDEPWHVKIDK